MKKNKKNSGLFAKSDILISIGIIIIITTLAFLNVFEPIDNFLYDLLLHFRKNPEQHENIVLVNIDDKSIEELGTWPWPRSIHADTLLKLRELGAEKVIYDVEFISPSQLTVDEKTIKDLPSLIDTTEEEIAFLIEELSSAISSGSLPVEYLPQVSKEVITENIQPLFEKVSSTLSQNIFGDNDTYFAQAIRFFGDTWLTINSAQVNEKIDADLEYLVRQRFLYDYVEDPLEKIPKGNAYIEKNQRFIAGMVPALKPFMDNAAGAGFTNVVLDSDGTRRRIELLRKNKNQYIMQLVFAPLVKKLNPEKIIRTRNKLILKNVQYPDKDIKEDIAIPLDKNGCMLINWLKNDYATSFKSDSLLFILDLDHIEASLLEKLKIFSSFKISFSDGTLCSYYDVVQFLLNSHDDLQNQKKLLLNQPLDKIKQNAYFDNRRSFFENCAELVNNPIYLEEILSQLNAMEKSLGKKEVADLSQVIRQRFDAIKSDLNLYNKRFSELKNFYQNKICIVGNNASSTTDMGVTPFFKSYANVGTHANIYNTIYTQQFIYPAPMWWGLLASIVLLALFIGLTKKHLKNHQTLLGIGLIFLFPIISLIAMYNFSCYIPFAVPLVISILVFFVVTLTRFIKEQQDKNFLHQAFSTYLSENIVKEIVNNPEKLSLGGDEKYITAFFTDIKDFSSLSEKLSPKMLVAILNEYLTVHSNIILELGGTIDKYIGDAIVAFFGAPIENPLHAYQACAAAIKMRNAEKILNKKLKEDYNIPDPITTRFGINTGNMVIGNMGTNMKMNYTIMGNAVNLASRLEGVNKVYHSHILVSEETWLQANKDEYKDTIVAKPLDKVRVLGIEKPVQLYTLLGFANELPMTCIKATKLFEQGYDLYLNKQFAKAKLYFEKAFELYPEDESTQLFIDRCNQYTLQPVSTNWTGIVTLQQK